MVEDEQTVSRLDNVLHIALEHARYRGASEEPKVLRHPDEAAVREDVAPPAAAQPDEREGLGRVDIVDVVTG